MATPKNIFQTWMESQQQSLENFIDTSRKFQESATEGKLAEKGTDIYKSWLDKQQHIVSTAGAETKQATDEIIEQSKEATEKLVQPEKMAEVQQKLFEDWSKLTKNTLDGMGSGNANKDMMETARQMYTQWQSNYQNWLSSVMQPISGINNLSAGGDMFKKWQEMGQTAMAYQKMQMVWNDLLKNMKNMSPDFIKEMMEKQGSNWLNSLMDSEKYKEVVDSMFQFATPDKFRDFYSQMESYLKPMYDSALTAQHQWISQIQVMNKEMLEASRKGMDNLHQYLHTSPMASQMEQMMAPLMKLTPAGKEKELFKLTIDLQEKSSEYWKKATELQHIIYQASQHAMEKVIENVLKKSRNGEGPGYIQRFL